MKKVYCTDCSYFHQNGSNMYQYRCSKDEVSDSKLEWISHEIKDDRESNEYQILKLDIKTGFKGVENSNRPLRYDKEPLSINKNHDCKYYNDRKDSLRDTLERFPPKFKIRDRIISNKTQKEGIIIGIIPKPFIDSDDKNIYSYLYTILWENSEFLDTLYPSFECDIKKLYKEDFK